MAKIVKEGIRKHQVYMKRGKRLLNPRYSQKFPKQCPNLSASETWGVMSGCVSLLSTKHSHQKSYFQVFKANYTSFNHDFYLPHGNVIMTTSSFSSNRFVLFQLILSINDEYTLN